MVIHLTTVHPRHDTRIRIKQVGSLADRLSVPVTLFVQDGLGDALEADGRVRIRDTGAPEQGRFARMTRGAWRMYRAVRAERPTVAHFHDPELIPVGLALKLSGVKVVYDVHEDLPRQLRSKGWVRGWLRGGLALGVEALEWFAVRVFAAVVPATPKIGERFPSAKTTVVQNFPLKAELVTANERPYRDRPADFAYVGGITGIRGAREMVEALGFLGDERGVRLRIGGTFHPAGLRDELQGLPGWTKVDALGWVDRPRVADLLGSARAGLVLFHPLPNHIDAQPNKLFEYMSAGLPVIASDFPLWRRIVDGAGCGLLVDPLKPEAIAEAMEWILDHPDEAAEMGRRGRRAVEQTYNWESEAGKLFALYDRLLPKRKEESER